MYEHRVYNPKHNRSKVSPIGLQVGVHVVHLATASQLSYYIQDGQSIKARRYALAPKTKHARSRPILLYTVAEDEAKLARETSTPTDEEATESTGIKTPLPDRDLSFAELLFSRVPARIGGQLKPFAQSIAPPSIEASPTASAALQFPVLVLMYDGGCLPMER